MTALAALRAVTAADHAKVDAAYGRFDLADPANYALFLKAHARALPAVEIAVAGRDGIPPIRPRSGLLKDDLDGLGATMPATLSIRAPRDPAEAFGMAYVIEGSRLGGTLLSRAVPEGLPRAYLSASHLPGEWRAFGAALDAAAAAAAPADDWIGRAIASARRVFALYAEAAR